MAENRPQKFRKSIFEVKKSNFLFDSINVSGIYCNLSNTFKRVIIENTLNEESLEKHGVNGAESEIDFCELQRPSDGDDWDDFYPKIQGRFHWFQRKKYQVHKGKMMDGTIAELIFLGVNYTKPWFILRGG